MAKKSLESRSGMVNDPVWPGEAVDPLQWGVSGVYGWCKGPNQAAETLGHIDFKYYMDGFSAFLSREGDKNAAAKAQGTLHATLSDRGVLKKVLKEIKIPKRHTRSSPWMGVHLGSGGIHQCGGH